jgi:hypothetical protein
MEGIVALGIGLVISAVTAVVFKVLFGRSQKRREDRVVATIEVITEFLSNGNRRQAFEIASELFSARCGIKGIGKRHTALFV